MLVSRVITTLHEHIHQVSNLFIVWGYITTKTWALGHESWLRHVYWVMLLYKIFGDTQYHKIFIESGEIHSDKFVFDKLHSWRNEDKRRQLLTETQNNMVTRWIIKQESGKNMLLPKLQLCIAPYAYILCTSSYYSYTYPHIFPFLEH